VKEGPQHQPQTFTLDRRLFAEYLERVHATRLGVDERTGPAGFTGSLCERLKEADDAGAIIGPPGYHVNGHALHDGDLIIYVSTPSGPRISHAPIEAKHVRATKPGSFDDCCETIDWILVHANPMLATMLDIRQLLEDRAGPGSVLQRAARALLHDPIHEAYAEQDPRVQVTRSELERFIDTQSDELASVLRNVVESFNNQRPGLPERAPS
jgi:hypothetical protein